MVPAQIRQDGRTVTDLSGIRTQDPIEITLDHSAIPSDPKMNSAADRRHWHHN